MGQAAGLVAGGEGLERRQSPALIRPPEASSATPTVCPCCWRPCTIAIALLSSRDHCSLL